MEPFKLLIHLQIYFKIFQLLNFRKKPWTENPKLLLGQLPSLVLNQNIYFHSKNGKRFD